MKPSIGRIVILKGRVENATDEHPAIITRVWSDECINVLGFFDATGVRSETSVYLFGDRAQATEFLRKHDEGSNPVVTVAAFWPERV